MTPERFRQIGQLLYEVAEGPNGEDDLVVIALAAAHVLADKFGFGNGQLAAEVRRLRPTSARQRRARSAIGGEADAKPQASS